ncbi:uncharacterized protein LOC129220901 [Uloborus diversus]|uniref:uncharacterized protein LOC129220901 n=1 Tax=Uloborus diversus TaxID=327109 RepID=UPI0024099175|nr:uncharacterized protein LOC129220901 [Uloborus diversus]
MTEKDSIVTRQSKEQLVTLNRQRGAYKGQITRIATFLEDERTKDSLEYQVKLDNLHKLVSNLDELKLKYFEVVIDESDLEKDLAVFTEIEELAENLEVRLRKFLLSNTSSNQIENRNDLNNYKIFSSNVNFKLPEMPLPKFSGSYQEWYTFREQFLTLIDSNDSLNDTQKLYYLKSTLSHSALEVVSKDDSYTSLFKALEDRFENKRFIVNSHMNELLMEVSNQDPAKSLRSVVDGCLKHIRALKTIGLELNKFSEVMLINIILKKLDKETRKQFELSLTSTELPAWEEFIAFLQKRCLVLENLHSNATVKPKNLTYEKNQKFKNLMVKNNAGERNTSCSVCQSPNHSIFKCDKFLKLEGYDRYLTAKKLNLCLNCLSTKHKIVQCPSTFLCSICSKKHHSLLHRKESLAPIRNRSLNSDSNSLINKKDIPSASKDTGTRNDVSSEISQSLCSEISRSEHISNKVLLATSVIYVEDLNGVRIPVRGILDCGSQLSLTTNRLAQSLSGKKKKAKVLVSGINGTVSSIKSKMQIRISNKDNSFSKTIEFYIVPKITTWVPSNDLDTTNLEIPKDIELADSNFGKSARIDVLIGAELFFEILKFEKQKVSSLIFQNTVFGYIVSGSLGNQGLQTFCGLTKQTDVLEENLQKFWKIESVEDEFIPLSDEEKKCENHFLETYHRENTGRFVVTMPLKEDPTVLGDSKLVAEKSLQQLWNRLEKTPLMRELYYKFIDEYETLGHMTKIKVNKEDAGCYYLPHHGVYRSENPTTKLRVVFNASSPSTNGKSLNDILFKGQVKEELYEIMIRFRKHRFVFLADIEKMYRQILINPEQRKLLRILWKSDPKGPVDTFELNTVTYGTSCAPFLAIRTLKQLAEEEIEKFSKASEVLKNDCYMDDVLSGADSIKATQELQCQLIELLKSAGMHLHKWKANDSKLLDCVNNGSSENHSFLENETKALGVTWKPTPDVFTFKVKIEHREKLTKRTILSDIARLFDPLGLIGPVITRAKTFMQELWKLKLDWNDPVPDFIANSWIRFTHSLKSLESLTISRYILSPCAKLIALHGFADASSIAFGATVYLQSSSPSKTSCHLISSKSQVAPLKTLTIPRLELSACLLLSKLVVKVLKSLKLDIGSIYLYTDSKIALAWIETPPWKLKTFVSNRVAKIQHHTQNFHWHHIASGDNPSDLISRGLDATDLVDNSLWWYGPDFLTRPNSFPEPASPHLSSKDQVIILKEMKDISTDTSTKETTSLCGLTKLAVSSTPNDFRNDLFSISNNFMKLIRIFSFIFRFVYDCRHLNSRRSGPLTAIELKSSETCLVKQVQTICFAEDIQNLKNQSCLSGKSKLKYLNPFLDPEGVLRVGGRLDHSNLSYEKKHPIVLPHDHKLGEIIFEYFHKKFFHVGPQALLHHVRQSYWIINGRSLARKIVHKCLVCFRNKPRGINQIMGNLPSERVNPSPSFKECGIDFCGPFSIKYKNQRKGTLNKIFVALFVCLATKAIHLDIVTDLKSESFIATLKRFFARRGKSSTILTDNGTTFVGANTELKKLHALVKNPDDTLSDYLASEAIYWKFIPPRSPNFGGLWEAGVKSFKHHLKRSVGSSPLTLEEFWTLIVQIEGILNSRPLLPLSSDPNEIEVLTPAHFLIGRPITSIVEPDISSISDNKLSSWQKITKMPQNLWKRWQHDYLNHLQQRNKWFIEKKNLKEGTMVIIKDENLPPCKWSLGRILKIIAGSDGKVRVLEIKTLSGVVKTAISKICPLPLEGNE